MGRSGERGLGISVLAEQHHDDDSDYLKPGLKDKRVYNVPQVINPRPEFELAYYDVAVQHVRYYTTETSSSNTYSYNKQLLR